MNDLPFTWQLSAGAAAGISEICAMYPLDGNFLYRKLVVKTRLQIQTTGETRSILISLLNIIQKEGFTGLYKGIMAPIMIEAPKRAIKFSANENYSNILMNMTGTTKLNQKQSILVGMAAGITEGFVVVPFELVKIRLQDIKSVNKLLSLIERSI